MKNCPVCHSEVQDDAKFCPECGTSFPEPNDTQTLEENQEGKEVKSSDESSIPDAPTDPSSNPMVKKERWYYVEDGQSIGPFDRDELLEKVNQQVITPETYIWSKGMKEWTQLHNTDLYTKESVVSPVAEVEENGVLTPIETFENVEPINQDSNEIPPKPLQLDTKKEPIAAKVPPVSPKETQTPPPHKVEDANETQDWYYVVNGRTVGPFSETVMVRNIHQGVVDGNTYVWKEGYLDWQHLKDTPLAVHLADAVRPNETVVPGQTPYYTNYQAPVTVRNIILYILLTIITCGIFEFIWLYMIASDINKLNAQKGKKPLAEPLLVVVFSIITCGIYTVYYFWKAGNDVYDLSDHRLSDSSILLAILGLFITPAALAILQDQVNALVESGEFR